jgi:ankyrin repeat protein
VAKVPFPDALLTDAITALRERLSWETQPSAEHVLRTCDELRGVLEMIIGQGADVNHAGIARVPPLCEAVQLPDEAIARCLLEHGADVQVVDTAGRTPAMLAKSRAMQDLLRKYGKKRD